MALTISLTPAEEARLRDQAAQEGTDPDTLATEMLREKLLSSRSAEEEVEALPRVIDEQGKYHPDRWLLWEDFVRRRFGELPVIPAEALTREALYQDHD